MLLSVITVALRNIVGVEKTWRSLAHLAKVNDIEFEWIVVDGNPLDGTTDFLKKLNGQYRLRYVSEKDNGIHAAMNKGIEMAQGRYALFLNAGDIFHQDIADVIRQLAAIPSDNAMIIGDALLDFGGNNKIRCSAKQGWYIPVIIEDA